MITESVGVPETSYASTPSMFILLYLRGSKIDIDLPTPDLWPEGAAIRIFPSPATPRIAALIPEEWTPSSLVTRMRFIDRISGTGGIKIERLRSGSQKITHKGSKLLIGGGQIVEGRWLPGYWDRVESMGLSGHHLHPEILSRLMI